MGSSIHIEDLLEKTGLNDTDIFIIQDDENTKKITVFNLRSGLVQDTEEPSEHRIYSSKKVNDLLDELKASTGTNLERVLTEYEYIKNYYATKTFVTQSIDTATSVLPTAKDIQSLESEMDNKIDKGTKFKSSDLDTTEDDYKLKLANLSQEVIDAMTGNTPISPGAAPSGGWTRRDLADECIVASKLDKSYRFRGTVETGSINNIITDGIYLVTTDVVGLPDEITSTVLLEVTRFFKEDDVYVTQKLTSLTDSEQGFTYFRLGDTKRLYSYDFIKVRNVSTRYKVTEDLLEDIFSNRGTVTEGSVFDIKKEGSFIATNKVLDLPTTDSYLIRVIPFGDSRLYQARIIGNTSYKLYESLLQFDSNMAPYHTDWHVVSTTAKSKFDNKNIHIYGDEIANGSYTDYEKRMTSLLYSRYGMIVSNHCKGNATMGNYKNIAADLDYSVLKQITDSESAFNNTTNDFGIIFAGGNDFREAVNIGNVKDKVATNTFMGYLNECIKELLIKAPNMKLLLVTPLYRASLVPGDGKDCDSNMVNNKYLQDFVDAIVEVGKKNHIPVLNLFEEGSINAYNHPNYLTNGVYLNDSGNDMICEKIFNALSLYY